MFPITLRLEGRKALLLGAGKVGRRKLDKLLRAGARVLVVEPEPDGHLRDLAARGLIELAAAFDEGQLEGHSLVFAASSDPELNRLAAHAAKARGAWVNVADAPELSDFMLPAVVEDGEFQLSVSTGGASPALAASVAADLRERFGPLYGRLTRLSARLRPVILAAGLAPGEREAVFKRIILSAELKKLLAEGDMGAALSLLRELAQPVQLPADLTIDD
ncbi:MAG: bifunctional precorrin-2 dehydrogenase/sirohydrochlorin ferrochelatase [Candidatus Adiutrix sp.]|jgi:siroheme synthase-like protein|nr:bifunctional precorrin-2 dehydrogenase/sirohydrochlorin ferrochelatase [Candidatus Adiutrix sp.]